MKLRSACLLALAAAWVVPACGSDEGGGSGSVESCQTDLEYFQQQVSVPLLEKTCIACHTPQGAAKDSKLVLAAPGEADYLRLNFETLRDLAAFERDGVSLILLKPSATIPHGGGEVAVREADSYAALEGLVERFDSPGSCDASKGGDSVLDTVRQMDQPATLRRASIQLLGRLPTPDELDAVSSGGEPVLREKVAAMLEEAPFYDQLELWFNDLLLTDKYLGGNNATSLLNADDYPNRYYYDELSDETEEGQLARRHGNNSVAKEPLKLISHVVRNDRPFTEILTADYVLVNPFSSVIYGVDATFEDRLDPNEWKEGKIPGIPHAGLLTSPMFLNRYPTTATNVNRHRSRIVWRYFLATDVLERAARPVDPTTIKDHNPTMNNPQCSVCHAVVDPTAGAFMNWDGRGNYRPPEGGWFENMRPAGFGDEAVPSDTWTGSLRWLVQRVTSDERFALAAVETVYAGLLGRPPLRYQSDDADSSYEAKLRFFNLEQAFVRRLVELLIVENYNLKVLVPEIVASVFYRASGADEMDEQAEATLAYLGRMNLLSPEELDRKLVAVTGYPFKRRVNDRNQLLHRDEFLFFYGGIDSNNVTSRIGEPNGIMANVGLRMASEMSCMVTPRDFFLPAAERTLFPHVEERYEPEDDNGFQIPDAVAAIRQNIRHMHARVLGEVLPVDHPMIDLSYQLFLDTWREGKSGLANSQIPRDLPGICRVTWDFWTDEELDPEVRIVRDDRYTYRAWSAVLASLLADWRFLYE